MASSPADSGVDAGDLTTVALACRDNERLTFAYRAAGGQRSNRQVEPHRLVALGRRWYLVAYDLGRHDWRSFRVDRLTAPAGTGARFRPRELPAADAAAYIRSRLRAALPASYQVEARLDAPAALVHERIGRWCTVEEIDATTCLLRMTTDSLDWAVLALGATGAGIEVRSPPELVVRLREWGDRFSRVESAFSPSPESPAPGDENRRGKQA
jgi:predicted DNA-binding transcriptional regulator YafY